MRPCSVARSPWCAAARGICLVCCALAAATAAAAELTVSSDLLRLPAPALEHAVAARLAATPLSWSQGAQMPLNQAVALLNASGNPTSLAAGVDGAAVADLPQLASDYWHGVMVVCAAYDLVMEPGESLDQSDDPGRYGARETTGTTMVTQGGAVVLTRRAGKAARPICVPSGVVLAEVAALDLRQRRGTQPMRSLEATIELRFEPHVQAGFIGTTLVQWGAADDGTGRKLDLNDAVAGRPGSGAVVRLAKMPEHITALHLTGELLVQMLEPVELAAVLKPGQGARTELLGQVVEMHLLGDGEATPDGQKGPGLNLAIPTAVLGARPHVLVQNAGSPVGFSMQGSKWSGGRMDLFFRGPKLADGDFTITIKGQAALQQPRLPLQCAIPLDHLPEAEATSEQGLALQVPTRVTWPAAHLTVREAVALLSVHGNQSLLELGVEENRAADVPAFSGTFWEGVLSLCRVFDLAIVPPAHPGADGTQPAELDDNGEPVAVASCITGGQLVLGAKRAGRPAGDAYQACGIMLMGIEDMSVTTSQGLNGVSRQADIAFRLRLEPRFDAGLIGAASVAWTTLAGESDGRPLVVDDASSTDGGDDPRQQARRRMRLVRIGRRVVQVPLNQGNEADKPETPSAGAVSVSGLPSGPVTLSLNGQATLALRREVRAELTLMPGGHGTVQVGGHPLTVHLFTNGGGEDNSGRSGISIDQGGEGIDSIVVEVRNPAGKALRNTDTSTSARNGRPRSLWFFPDLDAGAYTVVITAKEHLTTLRLPFSLTTTTP